MFASVRRSAAIGALLLVGGMGAAQPAEAHSRLDAIREACGSGYSQVEPGKRLASASGTTLGYVYLTYSASTGNFCAVTDKWTWHGTATPTLARMYVVRANGTTAYKQDSASYKHYASVKINAKGLWSECVAYWGDMRNGKTQAGNGRWAWGSGCG
jgi:hypothetical protein